MLRQLRWAGTVNWDCGNKSAIIEEDENDELADGQASELEKDSETF